MAQFSIDSTLEDKVTLAEAFSAANSKKNQEFHDLFPHIPASDHLIEEHGCAIAKKILHHGRMYVSVQHVSFKSEIFGWLTKISIRMTDIMRLEKANTAIIIPNAILIATAERDYFFASFLFRDSAFETIEKIWAMSRPQIDKALSMTDGKDLDSYDDSYDDGVFRRHVSEPFRAIETALPAVNDARSAEKAFAGETRQYEISTT